MVEFFANYGGSIVVGAIVLAIVALIAAKLVKDNRAGKHCCGGDCSGCCKCAAHKQADKR